MEGKGGLIELVLVFGLVLGWGLLELMSLRRYKKRARDAATKPAPPKEP